MPSSKPVYPKRSYGSYPSANVVFSISTALFLIGMFASFAFYAHSLMSRLQSEIEVQVFLNRNLSQGQKDTLRQTLAQRHFVAGAQTVRYVSKEEAAKQLEKETGEAFVEFIGENPLRDSYVLRLTRSFYTRDGLRFVAKDLQAVPGVFEVVTPQNLAEDITANVRYVGTVVGTFVLILLVTVVLLINNALRLALYSQRFIIRSMQLVGATDWFIKQPFVRKAALHGLLGGFLACIVLSIAILFLTHSFPELSLLQNHFGLGVIYVGLLVLGAAICSLSAYIAVSLHLRNRLDDLY